MGSAPLPPVCQTIVTLAFIWIPGLPIFKSYFRQQQQQQQQQGSLHDLSVFSRR